MMSVKIIVQGKVQGVFYRVSAKEKASDLGLTGTVKNTPNGQVEMVVTGAPEHLQAFIQWCHQGPPRAIVSGVIVEEVEHQSFHSMTIQ